MRRLTRYFLQGLVLVAPIAITLYVCWLVFTRIDRWLGVPYPGVGFVATIALVTLVGFLASNLLTRGIVGAVEQVMSRLPFVRLLYSSTRDLLNAFVGERRRFDVPVLVTLAPGSELRAFGFVTRESLALLGLEGHVAVYLPQSYNFAGNLLVCPSRLVERLDVESSEMMAFIVSGGVTGLAPRGAHRTEG
ncbi:MAG TPA: DUF502 domain-containing protein [Gemmatimonadaceae bacterium]|nr:DUF502 domain-containing protein [Gemmatimonadaceae bacterium]